MMWVLEKIWDFLILENKNIKLSYVTTGAHDHKVLIHGPCEPLFVISPEYLDSITGLKSYNFGLRHTDFADNYLHLYLYLQHNKAPEQLYLYVTPESFDLRFNTFHTFRFAAWMTDSVVREVVKEMDPSYYSYSWMPFLKYAYYNTYKTFDALQGLKHWLSSGKSPYFKDGHVPHDPTLYSSDTTGYVAPRRLTYANDNECTTLENGTVYYETYDSAQRFIWDQLREKYLIKMLELAGDYGIKVFLYESTPYWGSIAHQPNRSYFLEKTKKLALEYKVDYLLFDSLKLGQDKLNFVCPLILGEQGGKLFMQEFAHSIIQNKK